MKALKTWKNCGVMITIALLASVGHTHTEAETNAVARSMLEFVLLSVKDDLDDVAGGTEQEAIVTWPSFLALGESEGWTPPEKKAAFAWYLSMLGTNDCTSLSGRDQALVRIALSKCEEFSYADAVQSYKALALNPKGVCRAKAIELAIKYSPVDDATTTFVETIMTNSIVYNFREQGKATAHYASRLLSLNATNAVQLASRDAGVRMLYRNRLLESGTDAIIDEVFLKYIEGYGTSSNRLEYAINSLSYPKCVEIFGDYFTSVTNQLLSSGQPLPWINVGNDGN